MDMAISQFAFGKINDYKLRGKKLPFPGGWDANDELSNDPEKIKLLNEIIDYTHDVEPMQAGDKIYFPGERSALTREENLKNGMPVSESVWEKIRTLSES